MSGSANGHIVIRRQAKDGKDGEPGANGAKVRWGLYKAGTAYCSGATGEEFYDLVFHAGYQQFFVCIKSYPATETHSPSLSSSNGYWMYQPALDNLFVNILCANEAFLNNLTVRNIYSLNGLTKILEDGSLESKNGKFYGSFATPAKALDSTTNAVTLDFSTGFNYSGNPPGVKPIYLPTAIAYDGVECTITNLQYNTSQYFNIQCSDKSTFLYSGKYSDNFNVTNIHLYGCGMVVLKAVKVSSSAVRWFLINHSDFAYDYSKSALSNKIVNPNMKCIGSYTINSGSSLTSHLCADGNTISMTKVSDGQWKFTFSKTRVQANYMIVVAENQTAGIVNALNLTTSSFNLICSVFFEMANQWYYYNPSKLKFFVIEYDI